MGGKKWESADKPGSVVDNHSSGMCVATHLKQPTREHARVARCRLKQASADLLSYLVLLRAGFAVPVLLPVLRCALTAPFHPYQQQTSCCFGGLLSVALSVDSRPPGVTWRSTLWSPDFPPGSCDPSDCLANSHAHDRRVRAEPQVDSSSACRRHCSARSYNALRRSPVRSAKTSATTPSGAYAANRRSASST